MFNRTAVCAVLQVIVTYVASCGLVSAQVSVVTQHNDISRTGANTAETNLSVGNVNVNQFGKLFSQPVDGQIYGQPLYLPGVTVAGKGLHNVVYVVTMNDSAYAFDADSNTGANAAPLWAVHLTNLGAGITSIPAANVDPLAPDITGTVGIESTPVIDPATQTMYLLARTLENGACVQRLHAFDVTSGAEKLNSPTAIQATVTGPSGSVSFDPKWSNQRVALALANGQVYITWAGHNDYGTYHGWVIAYDAHTLQQSAVWNDTISGNAGGIWQAGQAPAIDPSGNLFFSLGNGTWDGVNNFGSSIVKLSPLLGLVDWFTPDNYSTINAQDLDLGASGPLLIPGTSLLLDAGKQGIAYLINTNSLGHVVTGNGQIAQSFLATNGHVHGSPIYWQSPTLGPLVYVQSEYDYVKAYSFNGSTFNTTPVMQSLTRAPDGMPGGFLTVSSNGNQLDTGILWASSPLKDDAVHSVVQGVLRAYDASNLANELWDTQQNPSRDDVGNFSKFVVPTVANGKVYMATFSDNLVVYGLLVPNNSFVLSTQSPAESVAPGASISYTVSVSASPGASFNGDVTFSASNLPPGTTASFSPSVIAGQGSSFVTISAANSVAPGTYSFHVTATSGANSQTIQLQLTISAQAVGFGSGLSVDLGSPAVAGFSAFSAGAYTVSGSGSGIWGTTDQFRYTYWQFPGDGSITARVVAPANAAMYSKSGVMIRSSLYANSSYAFMAALPSLDSFQYRNGTNAVAAASPYYSPSYPMWVRVVRANGNFTGYTSTNGNIWTQIGDTVSISMPQTAYVGLAVCSQTNQLSSAKFDNLSIVSGANNNPDFSVAVNPLGPVVLAGNTAAIATSITGINGFTDPVSFATSGAPAGISAVFHPASVNGTGTATLGLSTSPAVAPGAYTVNVRASSGSFERTQSLTMNISSFSLTAASNSATVAAGNSATYTISDNDQNGYSGPVTLSVAGLPSGASASFEPNGISRLTSSTLTIYTNVATPAGTYTATVSGTATGQVRTLPLILVVQTQPNFSISVTPRSQTTQPAAQADFGLTVRAIGGFNGKVAFSVSGLPDGAAASFNPASLTGSGGTTLSVTTGMTTPNGTYPLAISAASSQATHTVSAALVVASSVAVFGQGTGSDTDVGTPAAAGNGSYSSSIYKVSGGGADIWTNSDQFNFNYWQMTGDGTWTVRLTGITNTSQYAKAGVMIRETLSAGSSYAYMMSTPTSNAFQYRTAATNYSYSTPYFNTALAVWLRIVRANNNFTAFTSEDGSTWMQIGSSASIYMANSIYVGLAVTAQSPSGLNTATFDSLTFTAPAAPVADFTVTSVAPFVNSISPGQSATYPITVTSESGFTDAVALSASRLPAGLTVSFSPATITTSGSSTATVSTSSSMAPNWNLVPITAQSGGLSRETSLTLIVEKDVPGNVTGQTIGSPALPSTAAFSNGTYTITAAGSDIWNKSDQFYFDYWSITGDVTITAQVASIQNTDFYTKAGLMVRESLNADSTYAIALADPTLFNFQYRTATGAASGSGPYFNIVFPMWLRVVRSGNQLSGFSSVDGKTWTQINSSVSIHMATPVYVGLAVCSRNTAATATAVFNHVTITTP